MRWRDTITRPTRKPSFNISRSVSGSRSRRKRSNSDSFENSRARHGIRKGAVAFSSLLENLLNCFSDALGNLGGAFHGADRDILGGSRRALTDGNSGVDRMQAN